MANVTKDASQARVPSIEVDKAKRLLRAFDQAGDLIMVAFATIGSREKPALSGAHQVTAVSHNPTSRPEQSGGRGVD